MRYEVQRLPRDLGLAGLGWNKYATDSEGGGALLDHAVIDHRAMPLSNIVCCAPRPKAVWIADILNEEELIAQEGRDES